MYIFHSCVRHTISHRDDHIVCVCPQVIQEENLQANSKTLGEVFMRGLLELRDDFDCVGDVRGKGLMLGLELVENKVMPVSVHMDVLCQLGARWQVMSVLYQVASRVCVVPGGKS